VGKCRTSLIIGLTGGIGSGKTSVTKLFQEQGIDVIDTDEIAHALTQPEGAAIEPIRRIFGDNFFLQNGILDRKTLRELVFTNTQARQQLESILHPLIYQETLRRLPIIQSDYGILVVPLLLETPDYRKIVNRILVIDCPEIFQISRTMVRSKISKEEVRAIMASQAGRKERLIVADDIIQNNLDLNHLVWQVKALHDKYTSLAALVTR